MINKESWSKNYFERISMEIAPQTILLKYRGHPLQKVTVADKSVRYISNPHYGDVIMGTIASQITSLTIVYSTVYSDAHQKIHQSSALVAFVWGIHRGPVNAPLKRPVTRKMFPFDAVIMQAELPDVTLTSLGTISLLTYEIAASPFVIYRSCETVPFVMENRIVWDQFDDRIHEKKILK